MPPAMRAPHLILLSTLLLVAASSGWAQDPVGEDQAAEELTAEEAAAEQQAAEEAAAEAAAEEEPSTGDRTPDQLSDAERLLRMQQVLELDRAKMERLQTDLATRQLFLDTLTQSMAEFQTTWDEMKARLEDLEPDSTEAVALQEEIRKLEQRYDRFNTHASLTFEAESALRKQIVFLERKIRTDRRALDVFRGTAAALPTQAEAPPLTPQLAGPAAAPALPGIPGVPGMPTSAPTPAPPSASILPETAEQIEARQQYERQHAVAEAAEAAVVTFVERKEALEVQIELEGELLEVDEAALENLQGYAQEQRDLLAELEASEGDPTEIRSLRQQIGRLEGEIVRVREEVSLRRVELDSLGERRLLAEGEQERVTDYAERQRDEAEAARKWLVWLESPLYPGNLWRWAVERGPRVLAVLVLAGVLLLILRISLKRIARVVVKRSRKAKTAVNRADTLALSFESLATTLILAACVLLVLQEAGLDVQTVLGGAAILGVAVAFGAQNLMRDYFTGFMMLLEDQYELGDLVTIGKITGTVERVNMRVTMLRDLEGRVHFVPNGQIGSLTNRTYDWARALVEIPVGPNEDVDKVMARLLQVADDLKADPDWNEDIVDQPQMLGVDKFTESGVIIKLLLKTEPDRMFPVRRELLRRVKKAFDEAGIEPGFPVRIVRDRPRSEG